LESHAAPRLAAACGRLDVDGEPGRGGDERHSHVDQRAAAPKFQTITRTLASRRWNIAEDGSHERQISGGFGANIPAVLTLPRG
jgi:hypothetical protein